MMIYSIKTLRSTSTAPAYSFLSNIAVHFSIKDTSACVLRLVYSHASMVIKTDWHIYLFAYVLLSQEPFKQLVTHLLACNV